MHGHGHTMMYERPETAKGRSRLSTNGNNTTRGSQDATRCMRKEPPLGRKYVNVWHLGYNVSQRNEREMHSWAVLGGSRAVPRASWAVCGTSWEPLGPSWSELGSLLSIIGQSSARESKSTKISKNPMDIHRVLPLVAISECPLKARLGHLGSFLGRLEAILERS